MSQSTKPNKDFSLSSPATQLRISAFLSRKSSFTHAQFSRHWRHSHAPIVVPWCLNYNIASYTQTHLVPEAQASFTDTMQMPLLQYDGLAQMTISGTPEQFREAFKHPYYAHVIKPDEMRFLADESGSSANEDAGGTKNEEGATRGWESGATATVGSPEDIIVDGEVKIEISEEIWEEWRKWDKTKSQS